MPTTHTIKAATGQFNRILSGEQKAIVQPFNDRYCAGDIIRLTERGGVFGVATGRAITVNITNVAPVPNNDGTVERILISIQGPSHDNIVVGSPQNALQELKDFAQAPVRAARRLSAREVEAQLVLAIVENTYMDAEPDTAPEVHLARHILSLGDWTPKATA